MSSRTIHTLLARLGLPDADYRAMLWDRYKASSSKGLTAAQAADLVSILQELLPPRARCSSQPQRPTKAVLRFEGLAGRADRATPKQLRMLEAAFVQRSRGLTLGEKQKAFRAWLQSHCHTTPEWIQRDQVGAILKAVTSIRPDAMPRVASNAVQTTHQPTAKGT